MTYISKRQFTYYTVLYINVHKDASRLTVASLEETESENEAREL